MKSLVKVALKTADYKDMVGIVSKLAENFQDVIACFALEMTEKFVSGLSVSVSLLHIPDFHPTCRFRQS